MSVYPGTKIEFDKYGKYLPVRGTVAELRLYPTADLDAGDMIKTSGQNDPLDGLGADWVWNATSQATDDGTSVIQPQFLPAGRWTRIVNSLGIVANSGGNAPNIAPSQAVLAAPTGATNVGFKNANAAPNGDFASTGFVARSVDDKLKDTISILDYGVSEANADNSVQLANAVADARRLADSYAVPPRLIVPAGIYKYSTSPNWGMSGLHLDCQPGATFVHTGTGVAFLVDGGGLISDAGYIAMKITGGPVVRGNANTTQGVYIRAIHSSSFEMEVQNVSQEAFFLSWTVCNEYTFRCSPVHRPSFNPVPTSGIFLTSRFPNQQVSACTFYNPIIEGLTGKYGINLNDAIMNTFIGGTSESNGGGVFISSSSAYNRFIKTDFEFNVGGYDVFCAGTYNHFEGILADNEVRVTGNNNYFGGKDSIMAKLNIAGLNNVISDVSVNSTGAGANALIDNGTGTTIFRIRNAVDQSLYVDKNPQPLQLRYLTQKGGNGYLEASADQVTGGPATDTYHYKYGSGSNVFGGPGGDRIAHNSTGIGFYGKAPVARTTLPAAATDAATTMALTNALRTTLINLGLST